MTTSKDLQRQPLVGHVVRSALLVAATTVSLGSIAYALLAVATQWNALGVVACLWILAVMFLAPFFLVPLYFKWQSPGESSVGLAFLTGLLSWLLTSTLTLHLCAGMLD